MCAYCNKLDFAICHNNYNVLLKVVIDDEFLYNCGQ